VLLDWANGAWGNADVDRALTWVILTASSGATGRMLAERFAEIANTESGRREAVARRLADQRLSTRERQAVQALA
jgi:hypothetical protein